MKRPILFLGLALLTFAIGVGTATQVNRIEHYIWPNLDSAQGILGHPDLEPLAVEREHGPLVICPAMIVRNAPETPSRDKGKHPQAQIIAHSRGH
jgi:hypothetical protein